MRPIDKVMSAQSVVAAGLSGIGVKVVYDAKDAPYADLENKVMHLRPIPDDLKPQDLEDLRGDCDHETAHFKYTNIKAVKKIKCPLVKVITNVIEDGRIEYLLSEEYFGCSQNLLNSGQRAIANIIKNDDGSEEYRRRRALAGLTLITFGNPIDKVLDILGEDLGVLYKDIEDIIPTLHGLSSTFEVVTKAREIKNRWKKWANDHRKPKPKPKAKPKAKSKANRKRKQSTKSKPSNANTSHETKQETKVEAAEEPTNDEVSSLASSLEDCAIADVRKTVVKNKDFTTNRYYIPYTSEDVTRVIDTTGVRWRDVEKFITDVRDTVPVLRRKTYMEFKGVGRKLVRHKKKGKIDGRSLHKVALGSDRVFKRREPAIVVNAFVSLLVDCSASMLNLTGTKKNILIAAQCAAAMSQTLDLIDVDHECLGFTTKRYYDINIDSRHKGAGGSFDRVRPLIHLVVKSVKESYRKARDRFVAMGNMSYASQNVDGEALLWASQRVLSQTKEGAKPIIVVFSDGEPASSPEFKRTLSGHLLKTVKRVERSGVSVIGVGIGTDHVKRYFSNYVSLKDVSGMAESFFVVLRKVLKETSVFRR